MEDFEFPTTAGFLGKYFGAEVVGDAETRVERLTSLQAAGEGSLVFFNNRKYADQLARARGAVVLTSRELVNPDLPLTYLVVANPQSAFATVAKRFSLRASWSGISPQAAVSPDATIAPDASVGPFATIGEGAEIGPGTRIYPYAYVGNGVRIGRDCEIHPHATLLDRVQLGDRVKIFSGAVIGSEGFGLIGASDGRHEEMPQIGTVVIEDDVRVGAKCTIDRGTLGETRIGRGSKLDDQVHVGHNVTIGTNCVLCAQVGLAGSVVLEDSVILGGQVGLGQGVRVGKGAMMGGQSGTSANLPGGEMYNLTPAVPVRESMRINRYVRKLPEIWQRLKRLEAERNGNQPL